MSMPQKAQGAMYMQNIQLKAKVKELIAERDELKVNAARYLFVRSASSEVSLEMHAIGTQNLLDEYIDAAIAKAAQ
jgi:hypothetical protein